MRKTAQENQIFESSWIMLGCAWLLGFAMFAPMLCIPPIEHILKEVLRVSHAQVGLLFSMPIITLVAIAIPAGYLADRLGTRKAVGMGAIILAVGCLMRGGAATFETLLCFTCLYGVGFGFIFPNLPKLVGSWFPREKAALVTGIYSTGITTGSAIALAITLPVVFRATHTVQGTFLIWSTPAVVAAFLWWMVAKDPPLQSPDKGKAAQARQDIHLSPHIWRNKNLWLIALMLFLNNVHFYTWSGWTPTLMIMKGASPNVAALIASVRGWTSLSVMFLMPWASHRIGLRKPFLWSSAFLLAFAAWSAMYIPVPLGWPLMILVGVTVGGTFSMILGLPVEITSKQSVGKASGMVLFIGYIGGLIGPWLAGHILDVTGTLDLAFMILIGTAIVWAFITFLIPETGHRANVRKSS